MDLLYLGPQETVEHVRASLAPSWEVHFALNDDAVEAALPDVDAILDAYMRVRFQADRLGRASELKLFVTATTGSDHIDDRALAARAVPLLTLRDQREVLRNITPAAEHSWLLLMACARGLRGAVGSVMAGEWDRNKHPGTMLRGRTIGIVGCGRIGQWMATYASAFGMTCLGHDPLLDEWPETIRRTPMDELLERSDFVSIHVPLGETTRNLMGEEEFQRMKPGVVLVNTSRGEVIDETALLAGLESGRVAAAGLDVLTGEPEVERHPLINYARTHDNLVITPHIGGYSPDALHFVLSFCCRRILDYFGGAHGQA